MNDSPSTPKAVLAPNGRVMVRMTPEEYQAMRRALTDNLEALGARLFEMKGLVKDISPETTDEFERNTLNLIAKMKARETVIRHLYFKLPFPDQVEATLDDTLVTI